VIAALEADQAEFNAAGGASVSLADLIVLAARLRSTGSRWRRLGAVPPRRTDATGDQTDAETSTITRTAGRRLPYYLRAGEKLQRRSCSSSGPTCRPVRTE